MLLDHRSYEAVVDEREDLYHVLLAGDMYEVQVTDERSRRLASAFMAFGDTGGEVSIRAPMPGLIVRVPVTEGEPVTKGQTVVILESMKMENPIVAPVGGKLSQVGAAAGQLVKPGDVLAVIEY